MRKQMRYLAQASHSPVSQSLSHQILKEYGQRVCAVQGTEVSQKTNIFPESMWLLVWPGGHSFL